MTTSLPTLLNFSFYTKGLTHIWAWSSRFHCSNCKTAAHFLNVAPQVWHKKKSVVLWYGIFVQYGSQTLKSLLLTDGMCHMISPASRTNDVPNAFNSSTRFVISTEAWETNLCL